MDRASRSGREPQERLSPLAVLRTILGRVAKMLLALFQLTDEEQEQAGLRPGYPREK